MTTAVDEPEIPEVSVSTADTVVIELSTTDAQVLARILAHYDLITARVQIPVAVGFDRGVWQHTLLRLNAEARNARLHITAPTVIVPLRRPRGAHA